MWERCPCCNTPTDDHASSRPCPDLIAHLFQTRQDVRVLRQRNFSDPHGRVQIQAVVSFALVVFNFCSDRSLPHIQLLIVSVGPHLVARRRGIGLDEGHDAHCRRMSTRGWTRPVQKLCCERSRSRSRSRWRAGARRLSNARTAGSASKAWLSFAVRTNLNDVLAVRAELCWTALARAPPQEQAKRSGAASTAILACARLPNDWPSLLPDDVVG